MPGNVGKVGSNHGHWQCSPKIPAVPGQDPKSLKKPKKSSQPKAKHVASLYLLYGFEASWDHIFKQFSTATGVSGFVS